MTIEQQQVRDWMQIFGQETPEKPCIPSKEVRKLRAKLDLEEALETCYALNMHPYVRRNLYEDDMIELDDIGFWEDPKQKIDLALIADGCEDGKVIKEGTLVACGLVAEQNGIKTESFPVDDKLEPCGPSYIHYVGFNDPLFNEVMRSNFSKLWTREEINKSFILAVEFEFKKGWNNTGTLFCEQVSDAPEKWLVKDRDGKVIKSPSYSPANLQPIIDEMSK